MGHDVSLNMAGIKDNASKHNSKKQEDAGDDNLLQTNYYPKETRNYSVYLLKTDDIRKLFNYLMGRLRHPIALDVERAPFIQLVEVCRLGPSIRIEQTR
jgi:hypothetical protein